MEQPAINAKSQEIIEITAINDSNSEKEIKNRDKKRPISSWIARI